VCNLSISDPQKSSLESAGCATLESGVNFLKLEHAEMIIESRLEIIFSGKKSSVGVLNLIGSLSNICSRPNELDLSRLFDQLSSSTDTILPVLRVLCKNKQILVSFDTTFFICSWYERWLYFFRTRCTLALN